MSTARDESTPENPGLIRSLASLGSGFIGLIKTRVELIITEFEEEKERRKEMIVLLIVMVVFFCISLQLIAFFLIACFWDYSPLAAIGGVTALYITIGLWALFSLKNKIHNRPRPFSATLEEFENDIEGLHAFMEGVVRKRRKSSDPQPAEGE